MGLNPFHDFAALELTRFIASALPDTGRVYDLEAELGAVIAKINAVRG